MAQVGFGHRSQSAGGFGEAERSEGVAEWVAGAECAANPPRVPIKMKNHFVSLCSVCLRHLLQYFESLSFSAFARLFFVLE